MSSNHHFPNFTAVFPDFLRWWSTQSLRLSRRPLMAKAHPQAPSPLWCCQVPPPPVTPAPAPHRPLSRSRPNPPLHRRHLYHTLPPRPQPPMYPRQHLKPWSLRPRHWYPHLLLPRNEASSHACSDPLQRRHQTNQVSTEHCYYSIVDIIVFINKGFLQILIRPSTNQDLKLEQKILNS